VGTVQFTDTPTGLAFRGAIFNGQRGDDYLDEVRAGLNGVSAEGMWDETPRRMKDGTLLHRTGAIHGLAGADVPAFDGAHIALRDMEAAMADKETPAPEPTPEPEPEPKEPEVQAATREAVSSPTPVVTQAQRSAAEKSDPVVVSLHRSPIVITREALIYGSGAATAHDGSTPGFLSDGFKAWSGDRDAADRQYRYQRAMAEVSEHLEREALSAYRAGDVLSSEIPGAYPNEYLPSLLTPRILKGRPMGGFFNRFPITDANPKIFAKVTTSTSVAVQSAEGANPAASDLATTAVSVTPALYGAVTDVSRQVIDGSNPNAEAMLLQDMLEAYAQASETVIKTAVEAGASASGQAITAATPFAGLVANIVAYSSARFLPAQGQFIPSALWAVAAKQPDTSSLRPLLSPINPQNAAGVLTGGTLGATLLGADVFHSYASTTNVVVTARQDDYVIYESAITQFSYEQVVGPSAVRIGIWAYLGIGTRKGGLSVTAA
jgi:hypothetical protein